MTVSLLNILYHLSSLVVFFVLLSWITAYAYPVLVRLLAKITPEQSAFSVFVYGLLAPVSALVAILLLSLPQFSSFLVAEHCHGLDCHPHRLQMTGMTLQVITKISVFVGVFIIACTYIARQLYANRSRFNLLNRLAEPTPAAYKVLDSNNPFAWCTGLLQPKIFISRGLFDRLSKDELQLVIAHEQAHARRKDNLRKWLIHWATIVWPKGLRSRIRQDLADITEQVCDQVAMAIQPQNDGGQTLKQALQKCRDVTDKRQFSHNVEHYNCRIKMIDKASQTPGNTDNSGVIWASRLFISAVWLSCVVATVHLGHPLLEWIAT
ncbi:M56 family metallopeptidase [Planctobacterium marinum]|uniref:M56 family metallopeptidase n=1 Tax=Planctobacterium marinum TaxID=1631968 RepID=UPI001E4F1D4D|nr:M56 family metallopeptidase [Planctobacterium marinum]MCC2605233.1 M48 family metalloprotease [Planctobacterium marinum]